MRFATIGEGEGGVRHVTVTERDEHGSSRVVAHFACAEGREQEGIADLWKLFVRGMLDRPELAAVLLPDPRSIKEAIAEERSLRAAAERRGLRLVE
jgi:hypothetical protein